MARHAFYNLVPEFRTIHPATPDGPEECDALLQNSFASQHFDDMFDARDYSAWLATAGLDEEYRHYALQLRVLTASSPTDTTWALKSPSHSATSTPSAVRFPTGRSCTAIAIPARRWRPMPA